MKQNLYAVAALMARPDGTGKGTLIAGWYGAVSEDEAVGLASRVAKDRNPDETINDLCAILIPLDEIKKIIAQHDPPILRTPPTADSPNSTA